MAGVTYQKSTSVELDPKDRQLRWRRAQPTSEGVDDGGHYQTIPLSMILGGKPEELRVYTEPVKHLRIGSVPSLRGWYKDKRPGNPLRVRPRPCYSEAMLTTPYTGYCNVSCSFCYIDFGSRGYHATGLPAVNERYPDFVRKQLSRMMIAGPAYMSSFTEPFQELETRYHNVRRLTQTFVDENLPIFYLSRCLPPDWAEDALLANPYSYMQWSVNANEDETYRLLSPGSFRLEELFKYVERHSHLGIYTSFQINPILPGIVALNEIKELVTNLQSAGGNHFIFKFCESNLGSYRELLERHYARGKRSPRWQAGVREFESLMTQVIGGVRTIVQDLRIAWLGELLSWTRQLGVTMSLCYEYYDNGAAGANLAPWFTTSDQCHGPAVPLYYRPSSGERFVPLPGCYRKGCLYCAEKGTRACRNKALLAAKALQYQDYRTIQLQGREEDWELTDSCPRPSMAHLRGRNPGLATDAELWGLPPLKDVLDNPGLAEFNLGDSSGDP